MLEITLKIVLVLALASLGHCGTGALNSACKLSSDCISGLACDVRIEPISHTCKGALGTKCTNDLGCANDLDCISGACGCPSDMYYNSLLSDCIPKQTFGQRCLNNGQCNNSVCSENGSLQKTCKLDLGQTCSNNKDCVNQLECVDGKCNCVDGFSTYNTKNDDCDLIKISGENKACKKNTDCDKDLACDTNLAHKPTNTCLRTYDEFCQVDTDCANAMHCIDNYCSCPEGDIYDSITEDCYTPRQFTEACVENSDCAEDLACDVRVQPTPLSYNRHFTCLKTFGVECKNSSECVNYLPCNDGFCGCRPNYHYNALLFDCFPSESFGEPCASDDECLPTFGCDVSPSGYRLNVCLNLPGATCAGFADCVNNVDCIDGTCKCPPNAIRYDATTKSCIMVEKPAGEEEAN